VLRGLSSRTTRIRRPTYGAARMKKAMSAATAATGALGTRPPNVPEPAVSEEPGWPNGRNGPGARRGGADCALGGLAVGFELGALGEPSGRCRAIGVVVNGGVLDRVPRCPGASCPPSGVISAPRAGVRDVSTGTMTTDTSTPGTPGEGSGNSGSASSGVPGSTRTATSTSTDGTTGSSESGGHSVSGTSTKNT